jgi:hypothetical protein
MNKPSAFPHCRARCGASPWPLLAVLALPCLPLAAQTITNGGFETDTFGTFPGYIAGNAPITGWTGTPADRVGLNPAGGTPFANNGAIPGGANVAFIQAGTAVASLTTTVTDLTIGTKYNVSMRVNARNPNFPYLVLSTDGTGPTLSAEVSAVSNAANTTPYKYVAYEFTATATSHVLTIANTKTTGGDHTLLVDDVTIAPSSGAWSFAPWTNDATSGIDSQYVYTHAFSFGTNAPVTINGVPFLGRETGTAGRFSLTGLAATFGNRTPNNVTGNSANLAKDFRYTDPAGITLNNLKPNTQYVFTVYGLSFDDIASTYPHRAATFGSNLTTEKLTVNLNQYGYGNGILVNYTYTTDALGSAVSIFYPATGAGTFHTSGFSNREAVASTPPPVWTAEAWTDDATSGVDGTYRYTHAFSFGSTTGFNLNGVNFSGIGVGNPAGTNYTSANIPSVFSNDPNNVTGYGAAMARDFVYGGYPEVHDLSGLTPGKAYVLTLYAVGWEAAGARVIALQGGSGEGRTLIDQDQFGDNNGIRFVYQYTADSTGTLKVTASSYDGTNSNHVYGISNREATPMVDTAPSITLQPTGGTVGVGNPFVMRVGAIGSPTLTYKWKRGTTELTEATGPVLDLGGLDYADAGDYTVTITNGTSSVTSNTATVVVLENIVGLLNTGVGFDGLPLAAGATDPHFTLLVNPDNTESEVAYVQTGLPGAWLPNSATSLWIGPRANTAGAAALSTDDGEGLGTYVYRTRLDLTGTELSTVQISGSWASDNSGLAIRVNGVATGLDYTVGTTFAALKPFTINLTNAPGLIAGVNTLDFVVNNSDAATGFTGLRIDGLQVIGSIPAGTAPHIVVQPAGVNGLHQGTAKFVVKANGSGPLSYKWFKGETEILGETEPLLQIGITDLTVAGDYKVRVTNGTTSVDSNVAALTVTNANPIGVDDDRITDEDTPLVFGAVDLLLNDTDADGDARLFTSVAATSIQGGTVTAVDGTITYTPPPNFHGLDTFTYTLNDGVWGGTAVANVIITVNSVLDPPPSQLVFTLSGGVVNGTFTGNPGDSYTFQRSTTLAADGWTTLTTVKAPPSGIVTVNDPAPPVGMAFYRIGYTP